VFNGNPIGRIQFVLMGRMGICEHMPFPADKKSGPENNLRPTFLTGTLKSGAHPNYGALVLRIYLNDATLKT
jgi:hypothetical protein